MQKATCPRCGATAYATEAFCPACGQMLKGTPSAPSPPAGQPAPWEQTQPEPYLAPPPEAHPALSPDRRAVFPLSPTMMEALAEHNLDTADLIFSMENEEATVALVGTLEDAIVLRAGDTVGGYRGANVKTYPYGSLSEVRCSPGQVTCKLQFTVHLFEGKPEVGRRARMSGQKKVEFIAGVSLEQAPLVFEKFDEMVTNLSEL